MRSAISVQREPFDFGAEIEALRAGDPAIGAVVGFIGQVRDINDARAVDVLELEHYPGMTETALAEIVERAAARWPLSGVRLIHRIGPLRPCEAIVMVAVSAAHRGVAFESCEYIMDYLKTEAPFWKKETRDGVSRWVEARETDERARERWEPGAGRAD